MQDTYLKTKAFWLLREWANKFKTLDDPKSDYLLMRTGDCIKALSKDLAEAWETEAQQGNSDLRPHRDLGDIMPLNEWLDCVQSGGFIDYDGHGSLATKSGYSSVDISPSDITVLKVKIPSWVTHIVWYNR